MIPQIGILTNSSNIRRILIVRFGSMGDIIHSLPALATLKENFPQWEIDWLIESRWRPLLEGNPDLHRIVELDTLVWRRRLLSDETWIAFRQRIRELRERRYDCALDLQGSLKSAVACRLSGASEVIGFDSPWVKEAAGSVLYTRRVATRAVHAVEANLALAAALGARHPVIRFPLPAGEPDQLPAGFPRDNIAVLNPGAGWRSKCWPAASYGQVADALEKEIGFRVVLNCGPGEETLAAEVQAVCRTAKPLLYGGGLLGLIALLRRSRLMVGSDTGPSHLAAALGVPTVALFGPTDPQRNGPYGERTKSLRPDNAPTSYQHSAMPAEVMSRISPEEVLSAIRELLAVESEIVRDKQVFIESR
ncbi:MAG: lipopolysaccharide heptosyltransferase I [Acidobacteria bacterium]|nr:lipopolysaccharide heptosyltransferase I [Acidobacteriota bacterium]